MVLNVYAILFFVSLILLVVLADIGQELNITQYVLLFVAIMVSILGHYTVSIADSLNMAIMGQRMVYLGSIFNPILIVFCTYKLCRMKIPKVVWLGALAFAAVVMYFTFSIESNTAFYTSLELGKAYGMTILVKERGPMHGIYIVLLFACIIFTMGVSIYSVVKKKKVPYGTAVMLLIMLLITSGCYFAKRALGIDLEIVAFAYIIDEIIFLSLVRKISKYDLAKSVAEALSDTSKNGYIVFNKKGQYIGSNETAKVFFPMLREQRIDSYLSEEKTPVLYEKIVNRIKATDGADYEGMVEKDGRILKCGLKTIYRKSSKIKDGFVVEMQDDTHQQTYLRLINNYNSDLKREVTQKTERIGMIQQKVVLGMADVIENRDSNTGGHVKRTSAVIAIFVKELEKCAKEYGFSREFLENVIKAAPMHDLGKIAVDDRILRKPGRFTPEEYEEMKKHSEKGAEIVGQILDGVEDEEFVETAKNLAHYHHEKWNGEGYPCGLAGINIPPEGRIMALADVFDALVSKRCYKEKMDYDNAFRIIEESLGTHFDPELGKMFLRCRPKLEEYYNNIECD